jgi:hypothetical protein
MNIDRISSAKYAKALNAIDSEIGHKLLRAHLAFHEQGILPTREQLAKAVGMKRGCAANVHYGRFAHAIGEYLGFNEAPLYNGDPYWVLVLEFEPADRGAKGHTAYELRPEVIKAIHE